MLTYKCATGGLHNRLTSDYNLDTYNLTCLPGNQFSTPTWPTCAASIKPLKNGILYDIFFTARYCPDPMNYANEFITTTDSSSNPIEFLFKTWWVNLYVMYECIFVGGSVGIGDII